MVEHKEHDKQPDSEHRDKDVKPKRSAARKWVFGILAGALALVVFAGAYVFAVSPGPIRGPQMDHYHFRMQVVVDGKGVNFGEEPFQTPYEKGQCSTDLSTEPIHFHDQKGQFTHIHWSGITGGMVLKNYGWNFVGGADDTLGYRLDELPSVKRVPIHGQQLPDVPDGAAFWVYTGDEGGYQKRSFDEFKTQDLEQFFGKESNFPKPVSRGLTDWLLPKAAAHGSEVHDEVFTEEERLQRLNNLIGNVVIFVQANEPSDEDIKAKFASLEPLSDTTCGG